MKKYCFILITIMSFAQKKHSPVVFDAKNLIELNNYFLNQSKERNSRISNYLEKYDLSTNFDLNDKTYGLYDIIDNNPVYFVTDNNGSSITIRTNHLYNNGSLNLNVQGQNMIAGVWDGGIARSTHVEFENKILISDSGSINNHATHVTGTIAATGISPNLRGIAFNSSILSYDWTDDLLEMSNEALNGLLVSNHSYGTNLSSPWIFGAYTNRAKEVDLLANNAPYYTIVKSAGNDRNNFDDNSISNQINLKGGYDLLKDWSNSKNIIVVGAVGQVFNYVDNNSVNMSSFSSWGPTDDGRIKPDVVAKGVGVTSTTSTNDTSSGTLQGTSMSSPAVSGACLLLQQHYNNVHNQYMLSSTVKGILCHTADEAGFYIGPDYEFGWGLVNAKKAAELISWSLAGNQSKILQPVLTNQQVYTTTVYSNGIEPLMASICWNDPASNNVNINVVDPNTAYLVNDLDIRISKDGSTYFPWTLDPALPYNPALRTLDNFRDNIEKIQIDNPIAGNYTITVTHKGNLLGGSQQFSLIVSGISQTLSNEDSSILEFLIFPNPNNGKFSIQSAFDELDLEIYDVQGRLVHNVSLKEKLSTIDVSNLPNGVYFVKATNENTFKTKKIIIN